MSGTRALEVYTTNIEQSMTDLETSHTLCAHRTRPRYHHTNPLTYLGILENPPLTSTQRTQAQSYTHPLAAPLLPSELVPCCGIHITSILPCGYDLLRIPGTGKASNVRLFVSRRLH